MNSRELYRAGKLDEAVQALGSELRNDPTDTRRRTFLFELPCRESGLAGVGTQTGHWGRPGRGAGRQLFQ